ncbi:hypothetical protein [Spiroplasma floricola]|uniref:ABC transporter ATP-binding protein n=1 Tax=Spiroplasma floricola 23-6 TaxID=1336749 RepID=A0A2K8SDQ1_9MOLU|nr:hypothetical protein [Spiroplasma floricola]AUB31553.1 ABC transporter ATP-binding protein [Spiroplasma floricola 23-6]
MFNKNDKNTKENESRFLNESIMLWNNLKVISISVLKNLRTYLYIFVLPLAFITAAIFYRTQGGSSEVRVAQIAGFFQISSFFIIFLVNITISEWKNSVFLKRIHSSGVSKTNFLISITLFNFLIGIVSFLVNFAYILILLTFVIKSTSTQKPLSSELELIDSMGWSGVVLSLIFTLLISIFLGTVISGVFKSVALSQTITTFFILFSIVFSDNFLSPEVMGTVKGLVGVSYLVPYKHSIWIGYLMISNGAKDLIYPPVTTRLFLSFNLITWLPILTSIIYTSLLGVGAYFTFKWNAK